MVGTKKTAVDFGRPSLCALQLEKLEKIESASFIVYTLIGCISSGYHVHPPSR
jgi:hypothetical protein